MALVGAVILLCGSLVSCQRSRASVPVELQLQYYDQLGNRVEVPVLALAETEASRTVNEELSALAEEYRTAIQSLGEPGWDQGWFRCLCYPSLSGDYLSLVVYRDTQAAADGRVDASPTLSTWVYQVEEGRLLSQEEGLSMAGVTLEALRGQLEAQLAADPTDPGILTNLSVTGFRVGADQQVTLYLSARTDLSGTEFQRLYQWQDGVLERYMPPDSTPGTGDLLVPAEETLELSPALWCRWAGTSGEPEGGWDVVPITESLQNTMLLQRAMDYFDPYYTATQTRLLSASSGSHTLILVESTGGPHTAGLCNLAVGVWDEDVQDFVGECYLIGGDNGLYSTWEEDGVLWLLCSNSTTYQGDETPGDLGLFRFAEGELERVLDLPQAALDSGVLPDTEEARYLLYPQHDPEYGSLSYDFWFTRLAIPGEGGFDFYDKNPDWSSLSYGQPQWLYRGFVPLSSQPPAPLAGGGPQARSYYASLLQDVLTGQPLPHFLDDFAAEHPTTPAGYPENQFAVCDVDGDGREELLLSLYTTVVAGQGTYVLDYRADTGTLQYSEKLGLDPIFYENGAVLSPSSHNQGFGGRFWPYDVYQYNPQADRYTYAGSADAWDREISDQNPDFPTFPEELDVSGSGFLYYLDGDDTPVDEAVYLQWLEGHTGGTDPCPVQWFSLTEHNISRLSG